MFPPDTRILVVEDMESTREMLNLMLKGLGFLDVNEAKNGKEAVESMDLASKQGKPIRLVLSDINMEQMDGIELLKWIRSSSAHKNTPIIMVTAEGDAETVVEAIASGANNFIVKPVVIEALREKLARVWQRSPDGKK